MARAEPGASEGPGQVKPGLGWHILCGKMAHRDDRRHGAWPVSGAWVGKVEDRVTFKQAAELAGQMVDGAGVVIIVVGVLLSTLRFLTQWRHQISVELAYQRYRQWLGRAILLGLEFLIAGDIIRTVAVSPTFASVGVLALIVLIRTFLSLELEMEISGHWPWQRPETLHAAPKPGSTNAARDVAVSEESE